MPSFLKRSWQHVRLHIVVKGSKNNCFHHLFPPNIKCFGNIICNSAKSGELLLPSRHRLHRMQHLAHQSDVQFLRWYRHRFRASPRRVFSPRLLKNSSVLSMVSAIRALGTPEVTPRYVLRIVVSCLVFYPQVCVVFLGNTMARVCPWVMPCRAVSSWPIMWVAQSWDTPMAMKPFNAMVADIMNSLIK